MTARIPAVLAAIVTLLASTPLLAQVPQTLTYSGRVSSDGRPLEETITATFTLYDAETSGEEVWSESFETLDVVDGRFFVELGAQEPLGEVFDGNPYWLEIELNGEPLEPRMHVGSMPYAFKAGEADRVGGMSADELLQKAEQSATGLDYDNADSDLAAADVKAALDELSGRVAALESDLSQAEDTIDALQTRANDHDSAISDLQTTTSEQTTLISDNSSDIGQNTSDIASLQTTVSQNTGDIGQNTSDIASLQTTVSQNTSDIASLQTTVSQNTGDISSLQTTVGDNSSDIASLQTSVSDNTGDIATHDAAIQSLENKTASMSVDANGEQVYFTGVNVHVRSGTGATDGALNGFGNLIVGYDEQGYNGNQKSGSHNLVVGKGHHYTSYGGAVFGTQNTISDIYATVTGGNYNIASGEHASVSGGHSNTAKIYAAAVCGGRGNLAEAAYATISGGRDNTIWGDYSSISGGQDNTVSGGNYNSISGGNNRSASGTHDWRAGSLFEDN